MAEIERIEAATETVYDLFVDAGELIVGDPEMLTMFGIPDFCHSAIRKAWRQQPPSLNYGRARASIAAALPSIRRSTCPGPGQAAPADFRH